MQRGFLSRQRFAFACLLLAAAFGVSAARAQSPESTTGGTGGLAAGGSFSAVHFQYGQHWVYGAAGFVDANLTWHYGVEGEGNWSRWHTQEDTWATTYLIGPRYTLPAILSNRFRPYAKFLIGDGHINLPIGNGDFFVMAPGAGIDYHYRGRFDIRVCDFEYQYWPNFTFGSNTNLSVSAGIRYRIF